MTTFWNTNKWQVTPWIIHGHSCEIMNKFWVQIHHDLVWCTAIWIGEWQVTLQICGLQSKLSFLSAVCCGQRCTQLISVGQTPINDCWLHLSYLLVAVTQHLFSTSTPVVLLLQQFSASCHCPKLRLPDLMGDKWRLEHLAEMLAAVLSIIFFVLPFICTMKADWFSENQIFHY